MNQKARALLRKITFVFIIIGFIDYVVAFGLPHWAKYTYSSTGQVYRYGLFMTCFQDFIKSECDSFHLDTVKGSWVAITQGIAGVALFFYFCSTGTGFMNFFWEYRVKRRLLFASAATGIVAGLAVCFAAFIFSNANSGKNQSLDYGFFMALISIVPVLMGSMLNIFNGLLVRTSKKRKHLGSGFDIRQHMFDFNVQPPLSTKLKDHLQMSDDEYEEYVRPTTSKPKKTKSKPPNLDYFNEMLEELMDDESKQTESTTDGGGESFTKDEVDGSPETKENNETQKEGTDVPKSPSIRQETLQKSENESEDKTPPPPPVKIGVSFNDYPVIVTDRLKSNKPKRTKKPEHKVEKNVKSPADVRMARKNQRIAIMKVNCKKCPFEHTITKFAEDLRPEDYPRVVKYVENADALSYYYLKEQSHDFKNTLEPITKSSLKKRKKTDGILLKTNALPKLKRADHYSNKILPFDTETSSPKKQANDIRRQSIASTNSSGSCEINDQQLANDSACDDDEHMDQILDEISRNIDNTSKMSSIYIDTSLKMVEHANRPVTFEDDLGAEDSADEVKASADDKEDDDIQDTIEEILKNEDDDSVDETGDEEASDADKEGDVADDEEDIPDDTGLGPGLSDNESDHEKDAHLDSVSRKTFMTQASAKTYSSAKATSAIYTRPLVVFNDLKEKSVKKKKRKTKRAKTSTPKIDLSLVGRSHKSASLTKMRRAAKQQRVAIVHDRCERCCYELSIPKFEEDLTCEEKSKVTFIIDRSKSAKV